jgi:hypothetical protein
LAASFIAGTEGMRQVVSVMSLRCSYHYERGTEPLPDAVTKALDYLDSALKQDTLKRRADQYAVGAGMLADAMGRAAAKRGAQEAQGDQEAPGFPMQINGALN